MADRGRGSLQGRWLTMPPQKVLIDRQFFAIVREETHERPMHQLSCVVAITETADDVDGLLEKLWRDKS